MCGIYGAVLLDPDPGRNITGMRDFLRHRGPDDEGIEQVDGGYFGHLRLSIIDLSPEAAQPMWDSERQACITFNGEIYNYRELREECRRAGKKFNTASDTEVIINQYLLHGEAAFDRLNGIFAFCLYDARSGYYYLARDHMGVKPLYYADSGKGLIFSSELKALARTGLLRPEVDPAALQAYLQLDFVPAPLSILRGVHKLREGFLLHLSKDGTRRIRRFSSIPEAVDRSDRSLDEDVEEFGRIFNRAVKRQLVSDVPVGVFLSGGIDSSLVARAATEVTGSPIKTFSIGFEDSSFDESKYFSEVAAAVGSDHHRQILNPRAMLDLLPWAAHMACEPLADGSIFPTYLLCRFARTHVKVALSGDGADELFGGYPTYQAAQAVTKLPAAGSGWGPRLARLAHAALPVNYDNFSFDFKVKKLLEGLHEDPILRNIRWLGSFLPEQLPDLLVRYEPAHQVELEAMLHEPASAAAGAAPLEKLLRTDQRFYLQDGVLVKVDRASMANSLEVRVPYLDPDMVAFARSLPPDRKLKGREFKRIMKRFAEGKLPESVLKRPKKGFGTPLGKWFRKELKEMVADVLSPRRLEDLGLFRAGYVRKILSDHWERRRDNRKQIFSLLTFALWHETLGDEKPPRFPKP
jgi:asparagine synthase (glutamine-hydrolysing)